MTEVAKVLWAHPRNRMAERVLSKAPADPMGRYNIDLDGAGLDAYTKMWVDDQGTPAVVRDLRSGLVVRLFRADCGGGCRCAVEVGVWPADTLGMVGVLG